MNGKKFVIWFLGVTVFSGALVSLWMKQGYDTRPNIQIEQPKK